MSQLRSDTMKTPHTQRQRLPGRDRRERIAAFVAISALGFGVPFAGFSTPMANWPIWLTTLTILTAGFAVVVAYALWYRRRTPAVAATRSTEAI